jgi:hypothetical protein
MPHLCQVVSPPGLLDRAAVGFDDILELVELGIDVRVRES